MGRDRNGVRDGECTGRRRLGRRKWDPRAGEMDDGKVEMERMETGRHRC